MIKLTDQTALRFCGSSKFKARHELTKETGTLTGSLPEIDD